MKNKKIYTDPRIREHILPNKIVWKSKTLTDENVSALLRIGKNNASPWTPAGCILKPGDGICLDFGKEINGGVKIITGGSAEKICKVRIRFGESVSEAMDEPNNDHAIHNTIIDLPWHGTVEFGNTGFRFVRLDVLENQQEVEFKEVRAVAVFRNLEYKGNFECDDELLNEIWRVGAYTVHLNMQDYVWDGIKRDRLVWLGDMHPEVKVICSVFDDDGVVPASLDLAKAETPLPKWINGISSYSLWWIIIQKDWFLYKGNFDYLKEQKKYLLGLIDMLEKFIDEHGNEILPEWRFLDWPTKENVQAIHAGLQALLILAFESAAFLCEALNENGVVNKIRALVLKLKSQKPSAGKNKQANALKVLAELASAKEINEEILAKNPYNDVSTFYGYYVLEARAKAGDYQGAMDLIKKYWGGMLDMGATTFWEDFDISWMENATRIDELPQNGKKDIHKDFGNYCYKGLRHSLCHGWAGGPTAWLSEHVLGFKPLAPGFKKIQVAPELGDLKWARGTIPTPYGIVEAIHERKSDGEIYSKVTAPDIIEITG